MKTTEFFNLRYQMSATLKAEPHGDGWMYSYQLKVPGLVAYSGSSRRHMPYPDWQTAKQAGITYLVGFGDRLPTERRQVLDRWVRQFSRAIQY